MRTKVKATPVINAHAPRKRKAGITAASVACGVITLDEPAINARHNGPSIFPTPVRGLRKAHTASCKTYRKHLGGIGRDIAKSGIEKRVCRDQEDEEQGYCANKTGVGRKPLIVVGTLLYALSAGSIALIPEGSWMLFTALRFLVGLGLGAATTAQSALIVEFTPTRCRQVFRTRVPR
jgi:hypothetical protein